MTVTQYRNKQDINVVTRHRLIKDIPRNLAQLPQPVDKSSPH